MKRAIALLMILGCMSMPVQAALDVGDAAPDFSVPAALGGKVFQYRLSEQLAKGPVVLYFFPAAFSEACSIEARQFAEAIDKFKAERRHRTHHALFGAGLPRQVSGGGRREQDGAQGL
jgi:thioredoxin-dependent peroxiredoxin